MNTQTMITAFKIGYDIANLEGRGYEDEEILFFLNKAQIMEVMKEVVIRRWTYISNLIKTRILHTDTPLHSSNVFSRCVAINETSDYLTYISSKSKITRTRFKPTMGEEWVGNILIKKEQSGRYVTSSLNHVILIVPRVYEEEDKSITIIFDEHTTFSGRSDFQLEYIKIPEQITRTNDSEVNEILHERIVNTAVDLAKGVWSSQEAAMAQQADDIMKNPEA